MPTSPGPAPDLIAPALLAWYDRHHRDLPWRVPPGRIARGERPDPYRVWLSEIMLQQTTVAAVKPYFARFVELWPDVGALAAAETDAVMKAWAGLGYYSRARNLKACAETVLAGHGGRFPDTEDGLRGLPGIGAYTAAAIAAIAFGRSSAVVDGNVERVVARLHAIETPLPEAKRRIRALVEAMVPAGRPGDFAQAMMDLGATICTPRRPACALCPLREPCLAVRMGDPERLPVKAVKPDKPRREGAAFVALRADGAVLLRKRPDKGLLAGMAEPPGTQWSARQDGGTDADDAPFPAGWRFRGRVRHVFTHFELDLSVYRADHVDLEPPPGWWWSTEFRREALPTVMRKAVEAALDAIPHKGQRKHPA
ncbi:MAG: A/G-specific adenine glycosylase [Rhizobiaceae bacterium]|nr:A/G-specific adenine glycosylase [Rhizobiaceae bacterium]MCV0405670.1 A/G-specific adenine glycosylase [Rhizobiaceae bacterium]